MTAESLPQRRRARPELRSSIAYMEAQMRDSSQNRLDVPIHYAVEIWRAKIIDSFAQYEEGLREMGSRVHFFAAPLDFFGPYYQTVFPVERGIVKPTHTLLVGIKGPEEAAVKLRHLGLTTEENHRLLHTTGILMTSNP